ncbi:MAG TPA: hypothetical protein DDW28_01430 [Prevotella sp.]|nr:hypothetical protein [Candidatus Segatella violae]
MLIETFAYLWFVPTVYRDFRTFASEKIQREISCLSTGESSQKEIKENSQKTRSELTENSQRTHRKLTENSNENFSEKSRFSDGFLEKPS